MATRAKAQPQQRTCEPPVMTTVLPLFLKEASPNLMERKACWRRSGVRPAACWLPPAEPVAGGGEPIGCPLGLRTNTACTCRARVHGMQQAFMGACTAIKHHHDPAVHVMDAVYAPACVCKRSSAACTLRVARAGRELRSPLECTGRVTAWAFERAACVVMLFGRHMPFVRFVHAL